MEHLFDTETIQIIKYHMTGQTSFYIKAEKNGACCSRRHYKGHIFYFLLLMQKKNKLEILNIISK